MSGGNYHMKRKEQLEEALRRDSATGIPDRSAAPEKRGNLPDHFQGGLQ